MRIHAAGLTDIGKQRSRNEDSLLLDDALRLYVVADGVGGQPAGDVASRLAVEQVASLLPELLADSALAPVDALEKTVRSVNDVLLAAAADRPEWRGMATTLVVALVRDDRVHIANIGDSRAYLVRGQEIEQLSEDHTVLAEQVRLGLADGDGPANRMGHVLTRCLGADSVIDLCAGTVRIREEDRILLCSDGLTDSLSDEVIRSVVLSSPGPAEGCRLLVELANRNGGRDNITVLLIYFDPATLKSRVSNFFGRRS